MEEATISYLLKLVTLGAHPFLLSEECESTVKTVDVENADKYKHALENYDTRISQMLK